MSIKSVCRIILVHAFQEAFQDDVFGTIGDIFHCRHELHAVFFERVFMDRRFILITRKSIKFVNKHHVPLMFGAVLDHALKVGTQVVGACHGTVDICSDDQDVVRLGILLANAELTFNGLLCLRITAVPRIDDCDIFLWTLFVQ